MDSLEEAGYEPSTEFQKVNFDPLMDITLSDNTELWLIHCPRIQNFSLSDLDGQEVSLQLHHDSNIGSFVGSSGKAYDMVKTPPVNKNLAVFLSSAEGSKIVGKISRGVSLVHYPDPSEQPQDQKDKWKVEQMAQRAVEARLSLTPSRTLSRSGGHKPSSSMHKSSRTKSSGSGLASGSGLRLGSSSKTPMKRPNNGGEHKRDHSGSGSGKQRSN